MNIMLHAHAVRLRPPFYGSGNQAQLHRYLEPEFVQRFQRDLQLQQLTSNANTEWRTKDRFSDHDNKLVLRLPMHRSFYVFSCEVVCERLGQPALDPQKITSAGFVIRRVGNGREQSWMLEDDQALGWQDSPTGLRDPDVHRRLCRDGTLHPRENVATYTGELTHPIHPQAVTDAQGKQRTVLYGFLPLGGSYNARSAAPQPFTNDSVNQFKQAAAKHLPWPYGLRGAGSQSWNSDYARPVTDGVPSEAFFELLRLLCNRYHLGEKNISANDALRELCEGIYFYDQSIAPASLTPANFTDYTKNNFQGARKYSLWSWLQAHSGEQENPLVNWIIRQEKAQQQTLDLQLDIEKLLDIGIEFPKLPALPFTFERLPKKDGGKNLRYALYLTQSDAREFRNLLEQRVLDQAISTVKDMPLPKFNQGSEDVYQLVPFVRVKDDNNKERIYWADSNVRSEVFRVAAPFDPNASRPALIQMPSLKDLKKGLAKGVSMLTPADTFNLINGLNLKKGASEDVLPKEESTGIDIQWICSFSLPAISLVAMILLMIMISLLNIIFFWLPWIKICLPFPKVK